MEFHKWDYDPFDANFLKSDYDKFQVDKDIQDLNEKLNT